MKDEQSAFAGDEEQCTWHEEASIGAHKEPGFTQDFFVHFGNKFPLRHDRALVFQGDEIIIGLLVLDGLIKEQWPSDRLAIE